MARNMAFPIDKALPIDVAVAPSRPRLVEKQRGGRAFWVLVVSGVLVCGVFFLAALVHVELAQQQMKLDSLTKTVSMARDNYNVLRHQRSLLVSPDNLSSQAARLGMKPSTQARFVAVDPDIIAGVLASTGDLSDLVAHDVESPLNEFGQLKSEIGGAP
jgi:hypothetical protein